MSHESARGTCPVCGYPDLEEPPFGASGPSHEVCPSCGFEFGYSDDIGYERWREAWISAGMRWSSRGRGARRPPDGWDAREQLRNVEGS